MEIVIVTLWHHKKASESLFGTSAAYALDFGTWAFTGFFHSDFPGAMLQEGISLKKMASLFYFLHA